MSNKKIPSVRLNRSHKWQLESSLKGILPFDGKEELDKCVQNIFDLVVEELTIVFPIEDMEIMNKYFTFPNSNSSDTLTRKLNLLTSHMCLTAFRHTFDRTLELPYYISSGCCIHSLDHDGKYVRSLEVGSYSVSIIADKYESKTNLISVINDFKDLIKFRDEKLRSIIPVYTRIIENSRTVSGLVEQVPELRDEIFRILRISPCADNRKMSGNEDDDMKKLLMYREKNGICVGADV